MEGEIETERMGKKEIKKEKKRKEREEITQCFDILVKS